MKKNPISIVLTALIYISALLVGVTIISIVGYILMKGVPHLNLDLFAWEYSSENSSLMPAFINTMIITALALLFSIPVGILAAIYLVEYAKRGSRAVNIIHISSEILSGLPSIVYGLFGFLFFAVKFELGYSILGGALTLAIMVLPLIMSTAEAALKAVPDSFREGSFGLGASRSRTVLKIVLPSAMPGIFAGIVLSVGRIVGETAALIYTAGTVAGISTGLFSSGRTLAVHMYVLASEGLHIDQAYATAVALLVLVMIMNAISGLIASFVGKEQG